MMELVMNDVGRATRDQAKDSHQCITRTSHSSQVKPLLYLDLCKATARCTPTFSPPKIYLARLQGFKESTTQEYPFDVHSPVIGTYILPTFIGPHIPLKSVLRPYSSSSREDLEPEAFCEAERKGLGGDQSNPELALQQPCPIIRVNSSTNNTKSAAHLLSPKYINFLLHAVVPKPELLVVHALQNEIPPVSDALTLLHAWVNQHGYSEGAKTGTSWCSQFEQTEISRKGFELLPAFEGRLGILGDLRMLIRFLVKYSLARDAVFSKSAKGHNTITPQCLEDFRHVKPSDSF
ncbi:hypothetical protein CPC08DRAFT_788310 [Agrocybe pediades]|nr:hypothetical protein CPC08DRAFT_788310 [Agrocybe pediades]